MDDFIATTDSFFEFGRAEGTSNPLRRIISEVQGVVNPPGTIIIPEMVPAVLFVHAQGKT